MRESSINLDIKRVIGYKQFCNKLWNIVKFSLSNFPEGFVPEKQLDGLKYSLVDKWILTRLNNLAKTCNENFGTYKFGDLS